MMKISCHAGFNEFKRILYNLAFYTGVLILKFFHLIYECYLSLGCFLTYFKQSGVRDIGEFKERISDFSKIPSHLALIIGPEEPSYDDLFKLISWSFPAGIKHISFYDHKNGIDPGALFDHISKKGKEYISNIKWGKSFDEDIKKRSKKSINGFKWNPILTVHIYKREDGLQKIVETVKDLYKNGVYTIDRIKLNARFLNFFSAPEPDLALICGDVSSYYTYPPWHLRITQMQVLKSHHNLTLNHFMESLCEYCNYEQRYGR